MQITADIERYLALVADLDSANDWQLAADVQLRYARQIAIYSAGAALSEPQLRAMLCNYHRDHALVEALRDVEHAEHSARWMEWTQQTARILALKSPQLRSDGAEISMLDDLVQEALCDIWRGLPSFQYRSQFKTWTYTIISNCLRRHYRSSNTQKRGSQAQTQSLDSLLELEDVLGDPCTDLPEQLAADDLLDRLWRQVLAQHPDRRLATIFELWACQRETLQVIGQQLALSPTRVHTLLKTAIALLRAELLRQQWIEPLEELPSAPAAPLALAVAY